ncbi:MAG TPA: alpha/beta fold hydrolase [Patescibacteria group bacterium]|nr:alpha/beta fold hydrolase [Patescibacteria group bacterium]
MKILALLVAAALVFVGYLVLGNRGNAVLIKTPEIPALFTPAPTPFLFQEITIPFLREKNYESSLGEMTLYEKKANYTSYLTNYTSDGFKVEGLLTVPSGDKPKEGYPAVVFVHGYIVPETYTTTGKYNEYVDYLARNGFVVFKIDLRGHGKSEGQASGAYYSGDYIVDTISAYEALRKTDFVNPRGIGLWGHSMAGNVVFRSFVAKKDIPAIVIWAGAGYTYEDLRTYRITDVSYRPPDTNTERAKKRKLLTDTYGNFDPQSEFWKLVPGTNYLEGVKGSIQIHHAADDSVVSIEYSRNLSRILDAYPIPHKVFEYPSGGHNLTGSAFTKAMEETVRFFKENLLAKQR